MKIKFLAFVVALLSTHPCDGKPPAEIVVGVPHRKVFPADENGPARVYIEVPAKLTNTSDQAIDYDEYAGQPDYLPYVRRKQDSKHWTDIRFKGGRCGLPFAVRTLKPGESADASVLIDTRYSGRPFRLALKNVTTKSGNKKGVRISSNPVILPK